MCDLKNLKNLENRWKKKNTKRDLNEIATRNCLSGKVAGLFLILHSYQPATILPRRQCIRWLLDDSTTLLYYSDDADYNQSQ